jgi:hypothetical protein
MRKLKEIIEKTGEIAKRGKKVRISREKTLGLHHNRPKGQ